jgi:hypothetical protein
MFCSTGPWSQSKTFWIKFTHSFYKGDYLIKMNTICGIALKQHSLQIGVGKYMAKKFYKIYAWRLDFFYNSQCSYKKVLVNLLEKSFM